MPVWLPRNVNITRVRKKWHKYIEEQEQVLEYLINGRAKPSSTWTSSSSSMILELVAGSEPFSTSRDDMLWQLITEHEKRSPSTTTVAVLACLSFLRQDTTVDLLQSLKSLDIEQYLRCAMVVSGICTALVSQDELRILRALLSFIECGQDKAIASFSDLIEAVDARTDAKFLCENTVRRLLSHQEAHDRLAAWVGNLLQHCSLESLYRHTLRLHTVNSRPTSAEVAHLQIDYFPSISFLQTWQPDERRIHCWEHGQFNHEQREKLAKTFQQDGPDTSMTNKSRLYFSLPASNHLANIEPRLTSTMETLLQALYVAESIGQSAVDLFIDLCVNSRPSTRTVALLEQCLATGNDSFCEAILTIREASIGSTSLDRPIKSVTRALRALSSTGGVNLACTLEDIPTLVVDLWHRAQSFMLQRLSRGLSGEYIGMIMHEFAGAVIEVPSLHAHMDQTLVDEMRDIPARDVLAAIFRHLQSSHQAPSSRIKSYVEYALGGQGSGGDGHITLGSIQVEIEFWRLPPDTVQKDLASMLSQIPALDYRCYTDCLSGILKEKPQCVRELRLIMQSGTTTTCHALAEFLRKRRDFNRTQSTCWLLLLATMIRNQDESQNWQYFVKIATSMTYEEWRTYTISLQHLFGCIISQLPETGLGLTRQTLSTWDQYVLCPAVKFLIERQTGQKHFLWIYFPQSPSYLEVILERIKDQDALTVLKQRVLSGLDDTGANLLDVVDCFRNIEHMERATADESEREELRAATSLSALCIKRQQSGLRKDESKLLSRVYYGGLSDTVSNVLMGRLKDGEQPSSSSIKSLAERLQTANGALFQRARRLERSRAHLRRKYPNRTSAALNSIGIENSAPKTGRMVDVDDDLVDDDLVDAVEAISITQIEISFPLTGLSVLQRLAKGIPTDARMFLVRVDIKDDTGPSFCLHFSNEETSQHQLWPTSGNNEPTESLCNTRMKLFTFYVSRQLFPILRGNRSRVRNLVKNIHTLVQGLIEQPPQMCVNGAHQLTTKLWKPASCSRSCSVRMKLSSPLEVRLHNVLIDPVTMDLLLTSVYHAAKESSTLDLLPGCPVAGDRIAAVIDSMPSLRTLQSATNLRTALRAGNDQLGVDRERLLSWLGLRFRGFMVSPPDGFKVPNMGHAKQFLLVNSHHERETAYKGVSSGAHSVASSGLVFHGTHPSRLFLILCNGLQVQHGAGVLNGAAYGPGVYLGDEMNTSFGFARFIRSSWKNSALVNMSIMLGCELASYARSPHHPIHVITDENRVLVRYVFLLPQGFQCPPKHHVEPAMLNSFAMLRSGTS